MLKASPLLTEDYRSQAKAAIYPLIISQLKYDGHIYLATELERVYAGSQKVNPGSHLLDLITGHLERVVEKKSKLVDSSSQYSSFDAPYDAFEDKENHKPRMKPSPTKIIYDLPIESRANIKCDKVRLISEGENPHLDILDSLQALTPQLPAGWSLKPEAESNGNRESPEGQSDSSVESPEPTIEEGEESVFTEDKCDVTESASNEVVSQIEMSLPTNGVPVSVASSTPTSIPLLRDDMMMPNTPYTPAILNEMPVHEMLRTMASPNNVPNADMPSMLSNTNHVPPNPMLNNMPPVINTPPMPNNNASRMPETNVPSMASPALLGASIPPNPNMPPVLNSNTPPAAGEMFPLPDTSSMPSLPKSTFSPAIPNVMPPWMTSDMFPQQEMTTDMFPQQTTDTVPASVAAHFQGTSNSSAPPAPSFSAAPGPAPSVSAPTSFRAPSSAMFPQQDMTTGSIQGTPNVSAGFPNASGSFPNPSLSASTSDSSNQNMIPSVAEQLRALGFSGSIDSTSQNQQMLPNSLTQNFPTATIPQNIPTLPAEMPTSFPMNFPTSFPQNEVTQMNTLPEALRNIGKPPNVPASFPTAPTGFPTSLPPNFPTSLLKNGRPFDEAKTNTYYSTQQEAPSMSLSTLGGKSNLPFSEKSRLPSLLNQDVSNVAGSRLPSLLNQDVQPGSRLPSLLNQDVSNVETYGFTEKSKMPSLLSQESNLGGRMPSLLNPENNAQSYNPESGKLGMPYTATIETTTAEVVPPSPEFKMTDDMADILSRMMMNSSPGGPVYPGADPQSFPPVNNNASSIPSFPESTQETASFQPYNPNGGNSNNVPATYPQFDNNASNPQAPPTSYPPFDHSAPINSAYPPFDNNAPINTKYPPFDNTPAPKTMMLNEIPSPGSTVGTVSTTNSPKTSPTSAFNMWFKNGPAHNQSPMMSNNNQSPMMANNQSPMMPGSNQSPMTSSLTSPMTHVSSVKSTPMTSPTPASSATPLDPQDLLRLGELFNKQGNFSNNDWENLQLGQKTGAFSNVIGSGQPAPPNTTPFTNIGNTQNPQSYSNTSSSSSTPAPSSKHYFETDIVNQPESVESIWNSNVDKVGVIGQKKPVTKPSALDLNCEEKFIVIREIGIGGEINIVKATLQELIPRTGYFSFGDVLMSVFGKSARYSVKYDGGNDVKPDKMKIGLISYYTPLLMEVVGGSVTAVMNSKLKGNVLFPSEGYIIGYFGDKWRRFLDVKQTIQFICGADLAGYTPLDVAYGMFGDNWCRELRFRLNCENMLEMALDSRGNNMLLRGVTTTAIQ